MNDKRLKLSFACGSYDRTEPLVAGSVQPEGIELSVTPIEDPRALFDSFVAGNAFDLAEMSLTEHIAMVCAGNSQFVAIPVFPSKMFRHSFIVVNGRTGISSPKDLEGRRIGVPLYTMSAALWTRGMLVDDYGVDLSEVTWVQGAMDQPGTHGNPNPPPLLKPARIEINHSGYSLSELLARGEVDATLGALMPDGFGTDPQLVRLFSDFRSVEKQYYRRTKIHPIMHLVAIRKRSFERDPWIARSLFEAFKRAKDLTWKRICYTGTQKYMLPWLYADIDEVRTDFDGDPWSYGIEANRPTLLKAVEYMYRDNMIDRRPPFEELFVDVEA